MSGRVHLDLDGAWGADLPVQRLDARAWGPRLRYIATAAEIAAFENEIARNLPPFIVYGSGDFHQLAAVFARRHARALSGPRTVVSFDNHPDWDIRPPKWSCGAWVSRVLEEAAVSRVSVWGCGNFELAFPSRLFANRALRDGRLEVHAWSERQSAATRKQFDCMTRDQWRDRFDAFARALAGSAVYITVDMDCLRAEEAETNWENGLFTAGDVAWAIRTLRGHARVAAGDLCGARSGGTYARLFQRLAAWWDHPKPARDSANAGHAINLRAFQTIWPALIGE